MTSMALKLEIERPKVTSRDVLFFFSRGVGLHALRANDNSDETLETMGNDEDSVLRHRPVSARVRFPETDGADSVGPLPVAALATHSFSRGHCYPKSHFHPMWSHQKGPSTQSSHSIY